MEIKFALALILLFVAFTMRGVVVGMLAYGGALGRTWKLKRLVTNPAAWAQVWPRFRDSNLAWEEETVILDTSYRHTYPQIYTFNLTRGLYEYLHL